MTEHRISPLTWLSTKFASLNHTHSDYLTSSDISGKEDTTNKSSSISTDTGSTTKYPTVKAIEDYAQPKGNYLTSHQSLTNYVQKSSTNGLLKNDGSVDTNSYLTSHQSLTNYVQKSETVGLIKNDGSIDTSTYLTSHQSLTNYITKSQTQGLIKNDGTIDTNSYLSEMKIGSTSGLPVKTGTNGTLTTGAFGTSSGQFAEGNHTHSGYLSATKVTSWSSTVSNDNVPSEKLVKDYIDQQIGTAIQYITQ